METGIDAGAVGLCVGDFGKLRSAATIRKIPIIPAIFSRSSCRSLSVSSALFPNFLLRLRMCCLDVSRDRSSMVPFILSRMRCTSLSVSRGVFLAWMYLGSRPLRMTLSGMSVLNSASPVKTTTEKSLSSPIWRRDSSSLMCL